MWYVYAYTLERACNLSDTSYFWNNNRLLNSSMYTLEFSQTYYIPTYMHWVDKIFVSS